MMVCPPVTSHRKTRRSRPMPRNGARIERTGAPRQSREAGAPARITSCRSAWSARTRAAIASTMGTARGRTHGSWRPLAWSMVSSWRTSTVCWGDMIGRGRLERDAEVDRLAVRDTALNAAAPIRTGPHAVPVHVELVVVLAPGELGPREPRADLEPLARRQAQNRLGQVRLEPVEDGLAPAGRAAARERRPRGHRASSRPSGRTRRPRSSVPRRRDRGSGSECGRRRRGSLARRRPRR